MPTPTFLCDFCPTGEVDILRGKGRQELVYPSKAVIGKITEGYHSRLKYRCPDCIQHGVNTTSQGLTVHGSKEIKKWEDVNA